MGRLRQMRKRQACLSRPRGGARVSEHSRGSALTQALGLCPSISELLFSAGLVGVKGQWVVGVEEQVGV